ncbi:Smr/MutS family protein [Ectothiorhodospira lacustris]|uniref:Smr/MutS family protein n=1 Tax=Ectothiorhodospira lacustris TaxID=2899127 RepID=UPI001EE83CC9|nr:Smr/MutS family protein [Ectothiorhodospira lacustris]MCG5500309.1 Smr/MutS family endonuclease [Ectothiorhodospira lacustris]MCG5510105.1 Smr/MutS family endonuclease [Ectothiorhodospira lacustris]MCG5521948.1 Smr/MutS family endonuclease [Ectothiorhodospira lacustris]
MPPQDSQDQDDDIALFRQAVGPVEPVRADRATLQPRRPPPRPRQTEAQHQRALEAMVEDPFQVTDIQPGDELIFMREGLQRQVFKKLRRGHYRIGAELDLHGMTAREAHAELGLFIAEARTRRLRCVRIIHGKGLRSSNRGPVLKSRVAHWLQQRSDILAFCSARPADGGTGAVLVLLRLIE